MEGKIRFEVRPIEGGTAAVGELVTFEGGVDSGLVALNEDGEPFGKVPRRRAEELAVLLEQGYVAEVAGREGGVLTVEVALASGDAGPRREQFRLAVYPRSKEERKRVKKLALNSRVFFWEEDGKLEILDHEGYTLGAIRVGDYERVRAVCAGAYEAEAILDADGSLSVSVSYVAEGDAAAAVAASAEVVAAETADDVPAGDEAESPRMDLSVMAYPRSLDEQGRIAALAPGSEVFFRDEDERLELLDAEGNTLGATAAGDFERVRAAISGAYEAKATPNGTGVLDVCISYSAEAGGGEAQTEAEVGSDSGSAAVPPAIKEGWSPQGKKPPAWVIALVVLAVVILLALIAVALSPHSHDYEATEVVEATCTEDGYTVYTCSRCGDSKEDDYVDAFGHDYETTEIVEATCTDDGYTVYTCSRCGDSKEDDYVDALGHTVEDWTVDKKATCTKKGSKSGVCTVCGETVTKSIAKTEHTKGSWETVHEPIIWADSDSVYVDPGEKELYCSVCGELLDYKEFTIELTTEEENALMSAASYLDLFAFSYSGLIDQLEYEGFSTETATFAADNCHADWYEEAVESAESYLEIYTFSRSRLIEQLEYEGFTADQAEYAADEVGL